MDEQTKMLVQMITDFPLEGDKAVAFLNMENGQMTAVAKGQGRDVCEMYTNALCGAIRDYAKSVCDEVGVTVKAFTDACVASVVHQVVIECYKDIDSEGYEE